MLIRHPDGIWRQETPARAELDPKVIPPAWRAIPNGIHTVESAYNRRKRQAERWIQTNERNAGNDR